MAANHRQYPTQGVRDEGSRGDNGPRYFCLAVLSAAGEGAAFSPVQVQTIFFDREAADLVRCRMTTWRVGRCCGQQATDPHETRISNNERLAPARRRYYRFARIERGGFLHQGQRPKRRVSSGQRLKALAQMIRVQVGPRQSRASILQGKARRRKEMAKRMA